MGLRIKARLEQFPIRGAFVISRERRTIQNVVYVSVEDENGVKGQGECVAYKRYDERPEAVIAAIEAQNGVIASPADRGKLQQVLPHGAARNGLDCALWDYEAKLAGKRVWQLAGLDEPQPVTSMQTISLGTPEEMHAAAKRLGDWPVLKIKLGGDGDDQRIRAVRGAAPKARLVADPNEAWTLTLYERHLPAFLETGVALIEQPFPAGQEDVLADLARPLPLCADESLHDRQDLARLRTIYDVVNIKLDKAGGLTEAMALKKEAQARGFGIFVGSMVATSLAIAPAILLAQGADFVDLDPPLLLERDREPPIRFEGAKACPADPELWG